MFIKYYAPFCKHCQALAPIWADLAKEVEDIDDLIIAKFDATANELKDLEIRQYPTIKFYPKGEDMGFDSSGERTLEGLKNYLSDNSPAYQAARKRSSTDGATTKEEELWVALLL